MDDDPDLDRVAWAVFMILCSLVLFALITGCQTSCVGKSITECSHTVRAQNRAHTGPGCVKCETKTVCYPHGMPPYWEIAEDCDE